jgi:hypothetical protein
LFEDENCRVSVKEMISINCRYLNNIDGAVLEKYNNLVGGRS